MMVQIRFLKQGLLQAEIDEEKLNNMTSEELRDWAESILNQSSDKELMHCLSDQGPNGDFFIEAPYMEAVESEDGELLVATRAWISYSRDPHASDLVELDLEES